MGMPREEISMRAVIALLLLVGVHAGCADATIGQPGGGGGGSSGVGSGGAGTGGCSSSGGTTGAGSGGNGSGGARVGGTGGTTVSGTGGGVSPGSGGNSVGTGSGGASVGGPPLLGAFTDDFEDGDLTRPATASWRSTVRSDGDMAQWATITDGTKVVAQSLAADESELVGGDYRWRDVAIEAKVKNVTPDPRAGVCVRYKSPNDKWCLYLENIAADATLGATAQIELRMRSNLGSASSLPKVKTKDTPGSTVALGGWNTVKLEVHGSQFTAFLNGTMMFQYTDTANLVDSGGVAVATESGAMAEFDDVVVTPF
jgi:3-keto-disaccharide hydrolase